MADLSWMLPEIDAGDLLDETDGAPEAGVLGMRYGSPAPSAPIQSKRRSSPIILHRVGYTFCIQSSGSASGCGTAARAKAARKSCD